MCTYSLPMRYVLEICYNYFLSWAYFILLVLDRRYDIEINHCDLM